MKLRTALLTILLLALLPTSALAGDDELTLNLTLGSWERDWLANGDVIPPRLSRLSFDATPINQSGDRLFNEKIYWSLHSTRRHSGDDFDWNDNSTTMGLLIGDSRHRRTITVTAALYYNRSIYDTFVFTIDPNAPTMTAAVEESTYFTQGVPQETQVTITTQNLPDGIYNAHINWMPYGMNIEGWNSKNSYKLVDPYFIGWDEYMEYRLVRIVYGEVEIINGEATLLLVSDYTFGKDARAVTYMAMGINLEPVIFADNIVFGIRPTLTDIQFFIPNRAQVPGNDVISIWYELLCMYQGRDTWVHSALMRQVEWNVTGMAEGDKHVMEWTDEGFRNVLYIGDSTESRTITITASSRVNPEIYAVKTVYLDEEFHFTPTDVWLYNRRTLMVDFAALDEEELNTAIILASLSDDFSNWTEQLSYLNFTVDSINPNDELVIYEEKAIFTPDPYDETVRLVTITAAVEGNPDAYDYQHILVIPSLSYRPDVYISILEDGIITLHADNLPDGCFQIFYLSGGNSTTLWLTVLTFFEIVEDRQAQSGHLLHTVSFTDGVGTIALSDENANDSHLYMIIFWETWIEDFGFLAEGMALFNQQDYPISREW